MFSTLAVLPLVTSGCGFAEVDESDDDDTAEPTMCREEITEYDWTTAPVIDSYGTSYLADLYEWNAVDWSIALDGSETSSFLRLFSGSGGLSPVVVEWVPAWTEDAIWPCREDRATRLYVSPEVAIDSTALLANLDGTLDLFADEPYEFRWNEIEFELSDEWQILADEALLELDPTGSAELSLHVDAMSIHLFGVSGETTQPFWEGTLVRDGPSWAGPPPP